MADPYERVKGGRLMFKGGSVASLSKSIDKKNKKSKKKKPTNIDITAESEILSGDAAAALIEADTEAVTAVAEGGGGEGEVGGTDVYTIDAAKRRKYDELFPVEAKKFGYDPKAKVKSVEDALDDRVKKKADRYCK